MAKSSDQTQQVAPKGYFVREATGLVRQLGFYDSFLLNAAVINIAGGLIFDLINFFFFPGQSPVIVFLLGGIPALGIFIVYTIFSTSFARTGGDYVYNSRVLNTPLGFASGLLNVFGFFIFVLTGFNAYYAVDIGLPSLFTSLSIVTGNSYYASIATFITSNTLFDFGLSTLILIVGTCIVLFGMRLFRWSFRIIFIYYFVAAIALAAALLFTSNSAFVSSINTAFGAGAFQSVLSKAGSMGIWTFSLTATLLAILPIGFLTFTGFQSSTYIGSEVRNPKSTQALAMGISMGITWLFLVVLGYQSSVVFGNSFLQASTYLWATNPSALPFAATPFVSFLASLIYKNVALAILLNSIPIVGGFLLIPSTLLPASRIIFAQSFDRVLPSWFSKVNDRWHTPINSVVFMAVVAELWVIVLYYFGFISSVLSYSLMTPVAWAITAVAAIVFPYRKKQLYGTVSSSLPKWMRARPLGVPLIVIGGVILLVSMLIWIGSEFSPIIAYLYLGSLITSAIGLAFGIFIFAIIWFYAMRSYRLKHQGIDLSVATAEIPPE
jgi:amino acid transporter